MLKTLDILIGATTILLLFSMAVTVITQAVTAILQHRGKHLLSGLTDLLQQLGISERVLAGKIATALLTHPLIADAPGKLGAIIHREEFTKLLLDLASAQGTVLLEKDVRTVLVDTLQKNGISDPEQTLKNIWAMALQLEASNPELANHTRDGLAILHEGASAFVSRVNSCFDQTIDRVNHRFGRTTRWVTLGVAALMTLTVQLDVIGVIDRLSIDDQARGALVTEATKQFATTMSTTGLGSGRSDLPAFYSLVNASGILTLPTANGWLEQFTNLSKWPGMGLSVLLLSLGAPFWYNVLKDLLGLRSQLARNDETQRKERQTTQVQGDSSTTDASTAGSLAPSWLQGEQGDLAAFG